MKISFRFACLAIALTLWTFEVNNARAGSILVSDTTSVAAGAVTLPGNSFSGTEFTLTSAATITDGIAYLKIRTTPETLSDVHVTIFGDNGSHAPSATLYAISTGASGTLSTTSSNPIDFTFSPTYLPAGTYWFEVHDTNSSGGRMNWSFTNSVTNTGVDGTVNPFNLSPPAGSAELFQIVGSVPEPTTLGLLSIGAFGLLTHCFGRKLSRVLARR